MLCRESHDLYWTYFFFVILFIFRVFLALSEDPRDRGIIVAQGGGKVGDIFGNQRVQFNLWHYTKSQHISASQCSEKSPENVIRINWANWLLQKHSPCCSPRFFWLCPQALIPLALEGTEAGKVKASHALAKIASISNPEIAFPGERVRHETVVALLISIHKDCEEKEVEIDYSPPNLWLTTPCFWLFFLYLHAGTWWTIYYCFWLLC